MQVILKSENELTSRISVNASEDYRIAALLSGDLPLNRSNSIITYSFFETGNYYYGSETVSEVAEETKTNVRYILETIYESLLNVDFVEVADSTSSYGTLRYMLSNGPAYAYSYYPSTNPLGGDVHLNFSYDYAGETNGFRNPAGSHGYMTLIHETGHTLGLKHSGDYFRGDEPGPYLPYADDNITNTVMSYNFAGNSSAMLMPYDILALQYLYGDKEPNRGNTTYTFANVYQYSDGVYNRGAANPMKLTISDRGGIDTIDLSALSAENSGYYIDLTLGGLITTQDAFKASSYDSYGTSFGPYYTSTYGTRLDYETLIENLISTSNNDKIIGNQAINHISAGAGNDTVESGAGNDTLFGDKGIDQLDGDTGNDVLIGGAGDDSLTGGGGQDQFVMKQGDGIDIITDFGGIGRGGIPSAATVAEVDMLKFDDRGLTAGKMLLNESGVNLEITFDGVKDTKVILQNFQLEKLENFKNLGNISFDGQNLIQDSFDVINSDSQQPSIWSPNTVTFLNNLDNNIQGFDASDDVVNGQGGNDTIRGLSGNDTLRGGDGNDRLDGGNGNDTLIGMDGNDILVGGSGKDASSGGAGVDRFTFSALSESLLASIDVITDYASLDCIDAPNSVLAATLTTSVGTAAILSAAAISTVLTSGVFSANSACAFTVAGESGTFIALNNGTAGFNATDDSIIQLHGYSLGSVVIV